MEKERFVFVISGGIYPGHYRSTSVEVFSDDLTSAYEAVEWWCKKEFPDVNHYHDDKIARPLQTIPGKVPFTFGRGRYR